MFDMTELYKTPHPLDGPARLKYIRGYTEPNGPLKWFCHLLDEYELMGVGDTQNEALANLLMLLWHKGRIVIV